MDKEKFKGKYRIQTTRLQNWDYSWNAAYFVTICTKNKKCWFGEVKNGVVILSDIGQIVQNYWLEIPNHFSYVKLGEFVIMPNHIHGIIIIDKHNDVSGIETSKLPNNVETPKFPNQQCRDAQIGRLYGKKWKPGTLGVIINQFKRICTIKARNINPNFQWQSRFYEHIIRDEKAYIKISEYILNNPIKWEMDEYYE